jgi:hypothetical protein
MLESRGGALERSFFILSDHRFERALSRLLISLVRLADQHVARLLICRLARARRRYASCAIPKIGTVSASGSPGFAARPDFTAAARTSVGLLIEKAHSIGRVTSGGSRQSATENNYRSRYRRSAYPG